VELLSGVQERLGPLRTWLFPPKLYLQLADEAITAMALEGSRIVWLEQVALPYGLCEDGLVLRPDSLADVLGDLLVERGFAGARIDAVLPPAASQWRLVQWPAGRWPEDPERMLELNESALRLKTPLAYLDLHLIDLEITPPTSLVVTVPSKVLESWIEVFAIAGASLDRIEVAKMCACRGLQPLLQARAGADASAVLQLEPKRSSLLVLEQGCPVYERRLPGVEQHDQLLADLEHFRIFWQQARPRQGAPLPLYVHGSGLHDAGQLVELGAAAGTRAQSIDPLAQGWLEDGAPETGPRPAGPALALLWGLAAAEVLA
jgi:hypothetical protein